MRVVCDSATMRLAESSSGVPEPTLMQRAAAGLAGVCLDMIRGTRGAVRGAHAVALVGTGNNGGDALWALSRLSGRGVATTAIGDAERMHREGLVALRAAGGRVLPWASPELVRVCCGADIALDGVVGIGGSGGLRSEVLPALSALATAQVPIVAVDVASGVIADTGEVPGEAVRAAVTVTFGVLKPGSLLHPGKEFSGVVTVVDIGLRPADLVAAARVLSLSDLVGEALDPGGHKYSRGVVQVTAGSQLYPGAAHLAVMGARGSGVGMVALRSGPGAEAGTVIATTPDVVASADALFPRAGARVIGPGLGESPAAAQLLAAHLDDPAPLVVDASALSLLAAPDGRAALSRRVAAGYRTVVTPHEGEFARLGFDLAGGRLAAAARASDELGVVVVLKGPGTVVATPGGGARFIDTFGGPELGTAGSGDVLSGLVGGILAGAAARAAAGLSWDEVALSAARAVGLHGLAGRLAAQDSAAVTAPDIAGTLPRAALLAATAAKDAGDSANRPPTSAWGVD